ncbi:DNA-directed RNA polymerase [Bacillus fengqiuensis]|nr:DNA-directed RNA polymerase [Bacillus fengqiuensis]
MMAIKEGEKAMESEFLKQEFIKEFVDDTILQMKEGVTKEFKGYMYLDGEFRKGSQIVEEQEVRDYIYQFWISGTFSFWK